MGRGTYSGSYRFIWKEIGRPETRAMRDVLPVLVGRILDDGPALQERLLLAILVQHQAIARLPDRILDDVADLDVALAFAGEVDAHGLLLRVVRQRQRLQRLLELALDDRVEEADALHVGQLDAAHAVGAPQIEQFDFDGVLADGLLLLFEADDGAGQRAGLRGVGLLQARPRPSRRVPG